jgi:hypothetical protein
MVAAGREWAGSRAQVSQSYLDNADNADAMCRYGGTNAKWLQIDGPSGDRKLGVAERSGSPPSTQRRSQARRSRAQRVAAIDPAAIASSAQPSAAGRRPRPSGDRKLGALIPPPERADDGKARHGDQQKPGDDGNPCHRLVKLVGLLGWRGGARGVRPFGYLTHTSHDAAGPRRPQVGETR